MFTFLPFYPLTSLAPEAYDYVMSLRQFARPHRGYALCLTFLVNLTLSPDPEGPACASALGEGEW